MSKIIEYVIFNNFNLKFFKNNLITVEQFDFKAGHSTQLTVIQLVHHVTQQMDIGKTLINIYIDLSEAYDTLSHLILLAILNYYGVYGLKNVLFRDYLSCRHQCVDYNDSKSETKSVSIGVPQGSIVGPLLF